MIDLPESLAAATEDQPAARMALVAGLESPSHAYLFTGPAGSGKRAAARAFVAELLAAGAPDPDSARRRALADPSPHPDLAWLRPPGAQHLVDEVRERVIEAAPYRPFEGERRVFVIDEADAMAEESQNALLKTLEEPAAFAHLILISSQPTALLDTVRSRCREIAFAALGPDAVEARLATAHAAADPRELRAAARLAGGDLERAELLLAERGRELRARSEALARAARSGDAGRRAVAGAAGGGGGAGCRGGRGGEGAARRACRPGEGRGRQANRAAAAEGGDRGGEARVPPRPHRGPRHRARAGRRLASGPGGGRRRRARAGAGRRSRARAPGGR